MSIAFRLSEQKSREGKDRGTGFPEGSSSDAGDPEESHGGRNSDSTSDGSEGAHQVPSWEATGVQPCLSVRCLF